MSNDSTLGDIGERQIIHDILRPRYGVMDDFGDDCAVMHIPAGTTHTVATTDPCPPPAATFIGFEDYYYWGWLLATLNLSDLAAAGASPAGLLTSLALPRDFKVQSFLRILDGLDDCAAMSQVRVIGGNLKEASRVDISATAIGYVNGRPLRRVGAAPGDAVLILGDLGEFWAAFLGLRMELAIPDDLLAQCLSNVLTPQPKTALGQLLRAKGLVTACMDNSDGLYPSLEILARANSVGITLDMDAWRFGPSTKWVADRVGVDPQRLALGWGDWQLVVTARPEDVSAIVEVCNECNVRATLLGSVTDGTSVVGTLNGQMGGLMPLDSQRFTADSWLTTGIDSYVEFMIREPLLR